MSALYKELEVLGIEVEMLTNDFRSAGMARDLGVQSCTTVETIFDIDFVAQRGDTLILDSPEDDRGKLEVYQEMFAHLYRVANECDESSRYSEQMIKPYALIDQSYTQSRAEPKAERKLLFYGDSDSEKNILKNAEFLRSLGLELLLGEYFYADYESELEPLFEHIHESEEYRDLISSSSHVVTASPQTAYEAHAVGADTIYLAVLELDQCDLEMMRSLGITIVKQGDRDSLIKALNASQNRQNYSYLEIKSIAKMIQNASNR